MYIRTRNKLSYPIIKDAILLVATPFQLLCALEAIFYFKLRNYFLLIKASSAHNEQQLLYLLEKFEINDFYVLRKVAGGTFWKFIELYFRLKKTWFRYGFIGENGTAFRALCFSLKPESLYMLDDGVATFEAQRDIYKPSLAYLWRSRFGKLRSYRYAMVGMTLKQPKNIGFFSTILSKSIQGEELIKHKFENIIKFCKNNVGKFEFPHARSPVVFVDTPLYETRYLTQVDCKRVYEYALGSFGYEGRLALRPHRSQNEGELRKFLDAEGFMLLPNLRPIEVDYILTGAPRLIIGTVTTALLTLKKLFPMLRVIALDIRPGAIRAGRLKNGEITLMLELYEEFKMQGIEVVSLPIWKTSSNSAYDC